MELWEADLLVKRKMNAKIINHALKIQKTFGETFMRKFTLIALAITLIGFIGCEQKGPAEEAGERVDEVVDNIKHGDAPLKKKGAVEKLGDSIDDAVTNSD